MTRSRFAQLSLSLSSILVSAGALLGCSIETSEADTEQLSSLATLADPICVHSTRQLRVADRGVIEAATSAGGSFELGADAYVLGTGVIAGNAFLRERAWFHGDLTLGGTLLTQSSQRITGTLLQNADVAVPTLATKTVTPGTTNVELAPRRGEVLPPGNYAHGVFRAAATVKLDPGVYNFASLSIEPDSFIHARTTGGPIEINVSGPITIGDRVAFASDVADAVSVYSNASTMRLGTDAYIDALIVAPNAAITLFSRSRVNGCLAGNSVTMDTNAKVYGQNSQLPEGSLLP